VVETFVDDDKSAFRGKRRDRYVAMVEAIKAGEVTAIVAWAPDRLTRHPRELEDLIDLLDAHRIEVATHLAGTYDLSSSGGRMTARVVGATARHESEVKSERAKLKADEIAHAGRFHGGQRPFGYADDGTTVVPEEAEVIRFMARRIAEGQGLRRLAAELKEKGWLSALGKPWKIGTIRQVLTSPRIARQRHHRGEIVGDAAWPAIIDRGTWDELQAILTDPRRKQARPIRYLLTGLVEAPDGTKLLGSRSASAQGKGRGSYTRRVYKAPGLSIDAENLEDFVVECVLYRTDQAALPAGKAVPRVPSEVAALEKELEELAALRGKGTISLREWMAAKAPLDERLAAARAKVPESPQIPAGVTAALGRRGGLRKAWPEMNDDARRRALAAELERVVIEPAGPGRRRFDPDRIKPSFARRESHRCDIRTHVRVACGR
jgi:DNA invertase Pin-like site-specific DNA recombinase